MVRHTLLSLLLVAASTTVISAEDAVSPIVGAWELTSRARKDVATGKVAYPLGEQVTGIRIHTRGGHASYLFADKNRKATSSSMTDADRAEFFKGMAAGSGTYSAQGDTIRFRFLAAASPGSIGNELIYKFAIEGKTLTMTTAPIKGADGNEVSFVTIYQRLE